MSRSHIHARRHKPWQTLQCEGNVRVVIPTASQSKLKRRWLATITVVDWRGNRGNLEKTYPSNSCFTQIPHWLQRWRLCPSRTLGQRCRYVDICCLKLSIQNDTLVHSLQLVPRFSQCPLPTTYMTTNKNFQRIIKWSVQCNYNISLSSLFTQHKQILTVQLISDSRNKL